MQIRAAAHEVLRVLMAVPDLLNGERSEEHERAICNLPQRRADPARQRRRVRIKLGACRQGWRRPDVAGPQVLKPDLRRLVIRDDVEPNPVRGHRR